MLFNQLSDTAYKGRGGGGVTILNLKPSFNLKLV